jgi:tryptophanase
VRLAIPRRVYTASHLEYVAEAMADIKKNVNKMKGLELVYEPPFLRHFTAILKEVDGKKSAAKAEKQAGA